MCSCINALASKIIIQQEHTVEFNYNVLDDTEKIIYALRSLYMSRGYRLYRMGKFEEYDLYDKAAKLGQPWAKINIGALYAQMEETEELDYDKAAKGLLEEIDSDDEYGIVFISYGWPPLAILIQIKFLPQCLSNYKV